MSWFSVSCLSLRFGLESGERAIVRQHATTTRRFIIADPLSVYSFYSMTDARAVIRGDSDVVLCRDAALIRFHNFVFECGSL